MRYWRLSRGGHSFGVHAGETAEAARANCAVTAAVTTAIEVSPRYRVVGELLAEDPAHPWDGMELDDLWERGAVDAVDVDLGPEPECYLVGSASAGALEIRGGDWLVRADEHSVAYIVRGERPE
jgi:hypothetical protein